LRDCDKYGAILLECRSIGTGNTNTMHRQHSLNTKTGTIGLLILSLLSGCGILGKRILGSENVAAAKLAANCQYEEAFADIHDELNSDKKRYRVVGMLFQAAIMKDLDQEVDLSGHVTQILELDEGNSFKDEEEVRKSIDKVFKDIRKNRERKTGSPDCPEKI